MVDVVGYHETDARYRIVIRGLVVVGPEARTNIRANVENLVAQKPVSSRIGACACSPRTSSNVSEIQQNL
jgi:hypothetical protein